MLKNRNKKIDFALLTMLFFLGILIFLHKQTEKGNYVEKHVSVLAQNYPFNANRQNEKSKLQQEQEQNEEQVKKFMATISPMMDAFKNKKTIRFKSDQFKIEFGQTSTSFFLDDRKGEKGTHFTKNGVIDLDKLNQLNQSLPPIDLKKITLIKINSYNSDIDESISKTFADKFHSAQTDNANIDQLNSLKNIPFSIEVVDPSEMKKGNETVTCFEKQLFIVDGVETTFAEFKANISPEHIQSITILKGDDFIEKYGEKAKEGVVIVTTTSTK
jgi:hypothetical protein